VVQLPPVVVSHTQYTTTKGKKSLVTYELVSNTVSKHGYKGRDIIIFNTGKIGTLPKLLGNKELVATIKEIMSKK
jgi:hypothetical protein